MLFSWLRPPCPHQLPTYSPTHSSLMEKRQQAWRTGPRLLLPGPPGPSCELCCFRKALGCTVGGQGLDHICVSLMSPLWPLSLPARSPSGFSSWEHQAGALICLPVPYLSHCLQQHPIGTQQILVARGAPPANSFLSVDLSAPWRPHPVVSL